MVPPAQMVGTLSTYFGGVSGERLPRLGLAVCAENVIDNDRPTGLFLHIVRGELSSWRTACNSCMFKCGLSRKKLFADKALPHIMA